MTRAKLVSIIFYACIIQGCATLNESECRQADWQIIGLEDGASGKPVSQIGQHRKACAEHGVKPDMASYQRGYADGVQLFCIPRKGFELGKSGRGHHDVCPSDLRAAFVTAYDAGREIYTAQRALRDTRKRIKAAQADLEDIGTEITGLETKLVSGSGSASDRQGWLDLSNRLRADEAQLHQELHDLEHEVVDRQSEYDYLNAHYRY